MVKEILKTVLAGVLVGVALYIMPLILVKIFVIFLLFKIAFRLLGFGWKGHHAHRYKYHNMTPEQKEAFKKKFASSGCCSHKTEPDLQTK